MNIVKEVKFKGKTYNVTNPGKLEFSKVSFASKKFNVYQIVDQLNNLSEIKRNRVSYLKNKYGLTELEYYIIVVFEGDETRIPRCEYKDPKTGIICGKPRKFNTLVPYPKTNGSGEFVTAGIFRIGCEEHVISASAQVKQRECYKKGITGLQKADRKSLIWREKLRQHALKQMAEGNSLFSPDEIRRPDIIKPISSVKISGYNEICNELGIDRNNCSIEDLIRIDKEMFLKKGNPEDTCYYYLTYLEGNDKVFKLGVTSNIDSRMNRGYQNYSYTELKVLYTSTRIKVADLEEKVKLEFKEHIILGNEGFDILILNKVIEFINNILLNF